MGGVVDPLLGAMLASAGVAPQGAPRLPALQGAGVEARDRARLLQAGPGGLGLGHRLAHLDAPFLGDGAPAASSSQIRRTFLRNSGHRCGFEDIAKLPGPPFEVV